MIKIKEVYGYGLSYDERRRVFVLTDAEATEVGQSPTQDGAETKAKSLSKQEFKRIPMFRVRGDTGTNTKGELTSLNPDDESAWVSMEKGADTYGSGRQKINLRYDRGYYEQTKANDTILEAIAIQSQILKTAGSEIAALIKKLEKPIDKEYFNL